MGIRSPYPLLPLLTLVGCATWDIPREPATLPAVQLAPDGVVLEVKFVRVPAAEVDELERVWKSVDESSLPIDLRRRLEANGIRIGLAGSQLPPALRDLVQAEQSALEQLVQGSLTGDADLFSGYKRLQSSSGRRKRFVASPKTRGTTVVILNEQGQLRGASFTEAQGHFNVVTYPLAGGRARLLLTPEIEHGDVRQRWVAAPGTLAIDLGRESTTFEPLRIDTVLAAGQLLLVSSTPQPKGLGGLLFADSVGQNDRSVMLIRLAQSNYDDLFSDQRPLAPLATPVE